MLVPESYYYSGQGELLIATRNPDGTPGGFRPAGNVSALSVAIDTQKYEHQESQTGTRGTDLTFTQQITATITATMESINPRNLALATFGEDSEVASGTESEDTLTVAELGLWYSLSHINVDDESLTATAGASGGTSLVAGTDFEVDGPSGMIRFLEDGQVSADDSVTVTYDFTGYSDVQNLTSGTGATRWIRFAGLNTADNNKPVVVDVFKARVNPLSELALINEEIAQMEVQLDILSDPKQATASKYFRTRYVGVDAASPSP